MKPFLQGLAGVLVASGICWLLYQGHTRLHRDVYYADRKELNETITKLATKEDITKLSDRIDALIACETKR